MQEYIRDINSDVSNVDVYTKLINLYDSIQEDRDVFDSKEKFYILFDNDEELIIDNMTEVITENYILEKYLESGLAIIYGYKFEDIFINSKFTAHTHPPSYTDAHKRPSDGDYSILKNFITLHYVIDETYIHCISFNVDKNNGFYGKWNKETNTYISDEHYNIEDMKITFGDGVKHIEQEEQSNNEYKDTAQFKIQNDGTIILESY